MSVGICMITATTGTAVKAHCTRAYMCTYFSSAVDEGSSSVHTCNLGELYVTWWHVCVCVMCACASLQGVCMNVLPWFQLCRSCTLTLSYRADRVRVLGCKTPLSPLTALPLPHHLLSCWAPPVQSVECTRTLSNLSGSLSAAVQACVCVCMHACVPEAQRDSAAEHVWNYFWMCLTWIFIHS